jgi:hypothetical protein
VVGDTKRHLRTAGRRVASWRPTGKQLAVGAGIIAAVGVSMLLRDTAPLEMLAYTAVGTDEDEDENGRATRGDEYEDVVVHPDH